MKFASGTPGGQGSIAALLSVPSAAGMSLCFFPVCSAASPLHFLHHPGCIPEVRLSSWLLAGVLRSPRWEGIKSCCHGKGCLLPIAPGSTAGGGEEVVSVRSTHCLTSG